MDMRRINARNYAVYLQRRVEGYGDPAQPIPKWTEIDREAVRELVREFRRLERAYERAAETLATHGIPAPPVYDDEIEPAESAWMTVPLPPREVGSKWWQFWRRAARELVIGERLSGMSGSGYDTAMNTEDRQRFEQAVGRMAPGSRLVRAWKLDGGFSAEVTGLEIEQPDGSVTKVLVRRHGPIDLAANPDIAADEYRLLELVSAAGLPVPAPLYLDTSNELFPTPYMVVEYIEGETRMEADDPVAIARRLAAILAEIHSVNWSGVDLSFLPDQKEAVARRLAERPAQLDEALSEGEIRAVLEPRWPPTQGNEPRLLHGDFWPGNLLWKGEELAAIIDWEDAVYGDPLSDLAVSRLDTLWFFGPDAMDAFTAQYCALMPDLDFTNLPLWDLYAALRHAGKLSGWGLEPEERRRMERLHREFVVRSL